MTPKNSLRLSLLASTAAELSLALFGACDVEDETGTEPEVSERAETGDHHGKADMMIAKFDVDGDGAISAEEAEAHPWLAKKFAHVDADEDGRVTADEMQKMHGKKGHKQSHPGKRGHHGMRGHHGERGEGCPHGDGEACDHAPE